MVEFTGKSADTVGSIVHKFVKNPLPTESYQSTVGVYGGEIRRDSDGKMVCDTRVLRKELKKGVTSGIDVVGDRFLRRFDDHVIQNPLDMLRRHTRKFLGFVFNSNAPRHRGTTEEILENVERLGLTEYYGRHPWGIEIKKPEIFTKGISLQDVLRAKEIGSSFLADIDPLQALREAANYIKKIHDEYGPIGDLVGDIMFQKKEGNEVKDPVLNIPDVVLTPSKNRRISTKSLTREQKATDILEHLIHTGFEIMQQTNDAVYAKKALQTVIEAYADRGVLSLVNSFLKRGRPTLPGMKKPKGALKNFFPLHNKVHLSADIKYAFEVRQLAIEELTRFTS